MGQDPTDDDAKGKFIHPGFRNRAGEHAAPTDYVHFKLRIRAPLVKKLQQEAKKKKHSANHEAVLRLEQSFSGDVQEMRASATLDLMLGMVAGNSDMRDTFAAILRALADLKAADAGEVAKRVRDMLETYQPEGGSVTIGSAISAKHIARSVRDISSSVAAAAGRKQDIQAQNLKPEPRTATGRKVNDDA
jgi:hypothetical protein